MLIFSQLYLAHLLADFLIQPNSIARNKRDPVKLAKHSAIHAVTAFAIVSTGITVRAALAILLLAGLHSGIDYL